MRIEEYLKASPIFLIGRAQESITRSIGTLNLPDDLNFLEALIIIAIFFEPEKKATPSKLAIVFQTSRGHISHCITNLSRKILAKRRMHERDARSYEVYLTDLGKRRAISLIKLFDEVQSKLEKRVGAKRLADYNNGILEIMHCLADNT